MNILYISPHLGKGGAEDILVNISNNFAKNNQVCLFLFYRNIQDGYNISRLNKNISIKYFFEFKRNHSLFFQKIIKLFTYVLSPIISLYLFFYLKLYKFDIVHVNMTLSSFYLPFFKLYLFLIFNKKTKIIETFHTNWHVIRTLHKIIFSISWSLVDHVVYEVGKDERNNIKKYSFAKNISFIPFGIPREEKINKLIINEFSQKFMNYNKEHMLTLMSISRLNFFEKKIDLMLEITKKLIDKGFKNFKFIICGDGVDRQKIEEEIIKLHLSENIILTGFVDNPQQLVNVCDIFIVAMVGEMTGIAGLQAGMANKPVIGIQTLENYNGTNDFIYSSLIIDDLVDKIITLTNIDEYEKYQEQVYKYVKKDYDIDVFYGKYEELYKILIKGKNLE